MASPTTQNVKVSNDRPVTLVRPRRASSSGRVRPAASTFASSSRASAVVYAQETPLPSPPLDIHCSFTIEQSSSSRTVNIAIGLGVLASVLLLSILAFVVYTHWRVKRLQRQVSDKDDERGHSQFWRGAITPFALPEFPAPQPSVPRLLPPIPQRRSTISVSTPTRSPPPIYSPIEPLTPASSYPRSPTSLYPTTENLHSGYYGTDGSSLYPPTEIHSSAHVPIPAVHVTHSEEPPSSSPPVLPVFSKSSVYQQ